MYKIEICELIIFFGNHYSLEHFDAKHEQIRIFFF